MQLPQPPLTIEAVLERYDPMIRTCLQRAKRGVKLAPEDLEDLRSMVIVRMVERGDLARYDPSKAALSTYLWFIVRSTAATEFKRSSRRPTTRSVFMDTQGIVEAPRAARAGYQAPVRTSGHGWIPPSLVAQDDLHLIWADLTERFRQRLASIDPQLLTCWGYLAESWQKAEIAELMGLDESSVDRLVRRIRLEARAWRDQLSKTT